MQFLLASLAVLDSVPVIPFRFSCLLITFQFVTHKNTSIRTATHVSLFFWERLVLGIRSVFFDALSY